MTPKRQNKPLIYFILLPALFSTGCGGSGKSDNNASVTRDTTPPSLVNYGIIGSGSPVIEVTASGNASLPRAIPVITPTTTLTVNVGIVDESGLDMTKPPEVLLYTAASLGAPSFPSFPLAGYSPEGLGTPLGVGEKCNAPCREQLLACADKIA